MNTADNQEKITKRKFRKISFVIMSLLLLIVGSGFSYEAIESKLSKQEFPMTGKLVDAGAYKLHLKIQGKGPIAIIFEAGSGETSMSWGDIPEWLASYATVVSYDRGGYAWSEKANTARTGENIVRELHTALQNEGISGPYLLVGHSLGGMYTRLFAQTYREEVEELVLVDARPENDERESAPIYAKEKFQEKPSARVLSVLKSSGVLRIFQDALLEGMVPKENRELFINIVATPNYFNAVEEEGKMSGLVEDAIRGQKLGDLPVKVIARGMSPDYEATGISKKSGQQIEDIWRAGQRSMLSISSDSEFIVAEKSGRVVMDDEPELIKDVILKLVQSLDKQK